MKIKRYFGTDTRQVMRQIRVDQGPDAVILCCRSTDEGTEIITALEDAQAPGAGQTATAPARPTTEEYRTAAAAAARPRAEVQTLENGGGSRDLELIRRELRAVQGLLEDRFSRLEAVDLRHGDPIRAQLAGRLIDFGFSATLVRELTRDLKADDRQRGWHELLVRLSRRLQDTGDDILTEGGRIVLLGASGDGKTTTAAKLAARYMLRHGRHKVALISTDTARIGGSQRLRRYAELLQMPMRLAHDRTSLKASLERFRRYPLVIIDTPGLVQRGSELADHRAIFRGCPSLKAYLVASLTSDPGVFARAVDGFASWGLRGAILTKLDEAERLGGLLSVIGERHLPVAYTAAGQRIPEDLQPARAPRLVALALVADRLGNRNSSASEVA